MAERDTGGSFFHEVEWRVHGVRRLIATPSREYELHDAVPCNWSALPDEES